jgi:tRNA dimethylallyltransferase
MVAKITKLLVIVGPTASGKTALAIKTAKMLNGEIISADSRAIYKKMDIGTAKPDKNEQQGIKHWGLDLVGPSETFTASDFKDYANHAIKNVRSRNKIPILVGGSGLYINSVIYDYSFAPPNLALRNDIKDKSVEELREIIKNKHLELPKNYKNKRHLTRTIEVDVREATKKLLAKGVLIVGVYPGKERLKARIEQRLEHMLKAGVVDEIKTCKVLYGWGSNAMSGGIYKSFKGYIEEDDSLEEAKDNYVKSDLTLAKKQMTWFKRNSDITWFKNNNDAMKWLKHNIKVKI